jgi:hypothetical protein
MSWSAPTREAHERFCVNEGWQQVRNARGGPALTVSESVFWACANDGTKPPRGAPTAPKDPLPAELVALLINRVGLSEAEVAALSKEEAIARLNEYWTSGE